MLDVVVVSKDARDHLLEALLRIINGSVEQIPSMKTGRGKKLEFEWTGFAFHVDCKVCPQSGQHRIQDQWPIDPIGKKNNIVTERITIKPIPSALEFWIPAAGKENHAKPAK